MSYLYQLCILLAAWKIFPQFLEYNCINAHPSEKPSKKALRSDINLAATGNK